MPLNNGGEVLSNPFVQAGVTALNPEVGGALMLAKKAGIIKKEIKFKMS